MCDHTHNLPNNNKFGTQRVVLSYKILNATAMGIYNRRNKGNKVANLNKRMKQAEVTRDHRNFTDFVPHQMQFFQRW